MKNTFTVFRTLLILSALSLGFFSCSGDGAKEEFRLSGTDKITIGSFYTFTASNPPEDSVKWSVSDSTIASVNNAGRVKGLKAGTCVLTAKSGSEELSYAFTVEAGNIITTANAVDGYYGGGGKLTGSLEEGWTLNVLGSVYGQWMNRYYIDTNANITSGDKWILRGKIDSDMTITANEESSQTGVTIKFDDSIAILYDPYVSITANETTSFEYSGTAEKSAYGIRFCFDFPGCSGPCTIKVYDLELIVEETADDNEDPEVLSVYGSNEKVKIGKDGNVTTDGILKTFVADDDDFTTLVWSDEFNGTTLNMDNWTYELGAGGWGNGETQRYVDTNAIVSNGVLTITADKYQHSSRIFTKKKRYFQYGKIAARMKIEQGNGSWPAFWMMGSQSNFSWPYCGEIDIFEDVNNKPITYSTVHWNANGPDTSSEYSHSGYGQSTQENDCEGNIGDINTNEWHEYALIWTKDLMQFTVDDHLIMQIEIDTEKGMGCFQTPFFIIFNYAMGGEWPWVWDPTEFTDIPWHMYVDWVRVWQ